MREKNSHFHVHIQSKGLVVQPFIKKLGMLQFYFNQGGVLFILNSLKIVYFEFSEQFNILWKPNWTREAEKVLKVFERDVILKVYLEEL